MFIRILPAFVLVGLMLSCTPEEPAEPYVPPPADPAVSSIPVPSTVTPDVFKIPEHLNKTSSGLEYFIEVEGKGARAQPGQVVTVHYTQWLKNGTKLSSSKDSQPLVPARFVIGEAEVVAGWDEGIADMRVGETRWLVIPPELGFGGRDLGIIQPNSTLVARFELYAVQ